VDTIETAANKKKVIPPMTTMELLKTPGVPITLAIFAYSGLMGFSYTAGMLPRPQTHPKLF
jgi:hypothetical protein